MSLSYGCTVDIILYGRRYMKLLFNPFLNLHPRITGDILIGKEDRPLLHIHLPGRADTDRLKILIALENLKNRLHNVFPAQSGIRVRLFHFSDLTLFPDTGLDTCAPNIHYRCPHTILHFCAVYAFFFLNSNGILYHTHSIMSY